MQVQIEAPFADKIDKGWDGAQFVCAVLWAAIRKWELGKQPCNMFKTTACINELLWMSCVLMRRAYFILDMLKPYLVSCLRFIDLIASLVPASRWCIQAPSRARTADSKLRRCLYNINVSKHMKRDIDGMQPSTLQSLKAEEKWGLG